MQWFFNRDGIKEEVALERWVWRAIYKDGTHLDQFDDQGVFHQIREIQQENLVAFRMINTENPDKHIHIFMPEGAKFIHKYKNFILQAGTPNETRMKVYIFGYKAGSHHHFNYILPNGTILQADHEDVAIEF